MERGVSTDKLIATGSINVGKIYYQFRRVACDSELFVSVTARIISILLKFDVWQSDLKNVLNYTDFAQKHDSR